MTTTTTTTATYLALLRGINVGGKNRLPMHDLREMFAAAGGQDVRTYIQSGNVLFGAAPDVAAAVPARVTAQIAARFGYRVPVILRTGDELAAVIQHNPFIAPGADKKEADERGADENTLHVLFLAGQPETDTIAALDAHRSAPDAFAVQGREVYLYLPNGAARTKLTNDYFDTKLGTTSTGRNWHTVQKLLALMQG